MSGAELQLDPATVGVLAGSGLITSLAVSVLKALIGEKLPPRTIKMMAMAIAVTLIAGLEAWARSDFQEWRTALTAAGAALVSWLSAHGVHEQVPRKRPEAERNG